MALTLLDVQKLKKDKYEAGVVETFIQECDISRKLPISTIGTVEVRTKRTNSIPTVGFRSRGQMFGSVSGVGNDSVADAVYPMGATIDIDKTDMRDKAPVVDPLTDRTRLAVKGMAWTFNDAFYNGDHGTDADSFEGLKVRLATRSHPSCTVYGTSSTSDLELGAAIAANTTATMQVFLDKIDLAIQELDGHQADMCITDYDAIQGLKQVLRRLNIYRDSGDAMYPETFGNEQRRTGANAATKPVFTYNGIQFYSMGLKADQSTRIIGTDTVDSHACRPLIFFKIGEPYVHGIQEYPMEISKPYMLPDGVTWRTVVDWPVGLRHVHNRAIAALKGVYFGT